MPPTVVGPAQTAPLVEPARYELDGLNVKHVSPVRLLYEHTSEDRLSLEARFEELKNLLDLVADDGVEDHATRIRLAERARLRPFRRVTPPRGVALPLAA